MIKEKSKKEIKSKSKTNRHCEIRLRTIQIHRIFVASKLYFPPPLRSCSYLFSIALGNSLNSPSLAEIFAFLPLPCGGGEMQKSPQGRGQEKVNYHPTRDGLKILSLRESRSDSWQSKFKNCVLF